MKALSIDPAKLLGFRLGVSSDTKTGTMTLGVKAGQKQGVKPIEK